MRHAAFFRHLITSVAMLATLMLQLAPAISDMIFAGSNSDTEAICSTTNVNPITDRLINRVIKRRATRENQAGPDFPRQSLTGHHCANLLGCLLNRARHHSLFKSLHFSTFTNDNCLSHEANRLTLTPFLFALH